MTRSLVLGFLVLYTNIIVAAESGQLGGGVIVPVEDGLPRTAFNLSTDNASIFLEKATLNKENGWFVKDTSVALSATMKINSKNRRGNAPPLQISRIYKFDISQFDKGSIEIPLKSLPILEAFNLKGQDYFITSITMEVGISRRKENTDFSKTIYTLIEASKKIPTPLSPYMEYANVLGDTVGSVMKTALEEGAETLPFASFSLRFLPGDNNALITERTGTYAVILAGKPSAKNVYSIDSIGGRKISYSDQKGLNIDDKPVGNNYLVVRVTSSTDPFSIANASEEEISNFINNSHELLEFSKKEQLSAPVLEEVINTKGAPKWLIPQQKLEKAVKEANELKAYNPYKQP